MSWWSLGACTGWGMPAMECLDAHHASIDSLDAPGGSNVAGAGESNAARYSKCTCLLDARARPSDSAAVSAVEAC